ncbi:hypothetical protein OTU49_014307, partial [Cherax quadricarinatus]
EYQLSKEVSVVDDVGTPLEVYRDWVAPNRPVIFRGAVRDWPAIKKWTFDYLREQIGSKSVSVAVTPNGYADAPYNGYFAMPEERSMKFSTFLDIMEDPKNYPGCTKTTTRTSTVWCLATRTLFSTLPRTCPGCPINATQQLLLRRLLLATLSSKRTQASALCLGYASIL